MGSREDRKRKHCWNNRTKQKCVEPGISGLFLTCDGMEKQALNEAYNLIDEVLESMPSSATEKPSTELETAEQKSADDSSDEDIADSLKKACDDQRKGTSKQRRCKQRPTGVKNCLFVNVKDADVVALAERMVEIAQTTPRCRHLQRVIPVEETADVSLTKLNDMVQQCVARHLIAKEDGTLPSYAMEFKGRNNDSVKKAEVLHMLNDAVNAAAPAAKVDLSGCDVLFFVQVVRKTAMVGAVRDFYHWKRYSLRPQEVKDIVSSEKKDGTVTSDKNEDTVSAVSKGDTVGATDADTVGTTNSDTVGTTASDIVGSKDAVVAVTQQKTGTV